MIVEDSTVVKYNQPQINIKKSVVDNDKDKNIKNMRKNGIAIKNLNFDSQLESYNQSYSPFENSESNHVLEIKRPTPDT